MTRSRVGRGFRSPVLWLTLAVLLAVGAAFAAPPGPAAKRSDDFVGLWEGVDPADGSPVRLSLSDVNEDGVLDHTMQEDFFSYCFGLGPNFLLGRGVITGTATVTSPSVLTVSSELSCIDNSNVLHPQGVSTDQYTLRAHDLVLPPFDSLPGIVLHRLAP